MKDFPDFKQDDYMFPIHHKTIFLLDHTPYFGISCDIQIELVATRTRNGMIPLRPVSKSLWTCSVEASIEYSRVVWDLFPDGKLIRFVVSDCEGRVLNNWAADQQNIYRLLGSLSGIGAPPKLTAANKHEDYSIIHGFRSAIEAACGCTEMQHNTRWELTNWPNDVKIPNRCRIICITSARDDESINNLENIFWDELQTVNRIADISENLIPVTQCHLLIINTYPNAANPAVTGHPIRELSPLLTTEVIKCPAYDHLNYQLLHLLLLHYDLASTTITGIPMKEEQNANSSANYDVEVYHSSDVHSSLLRGGLTELDYICSTKVEGNYKTITLKWCTPRAPFTPDISNCTTLHRITPVNISSRPSACLVTFLLNGRTVLLETSRPNGAKIITHMLTSYGGEILIQSVHSIRGPFDLQSLVSSDYGSQVQDYRLEEFGSLVKAHLLRPMKKRYLEERSKKCNTALPIDKAINNSKRETKFWPLTVSSNIIFNIKEYTEPLLSLLKKSQLTQEDIYRCKLCIINLAYLEARKREPFPMSTTYVKGERVVKREEQFKMLWDELEQYMKVYCHSAAHKDVLASIRESRLKQESVLLLEKFDIEQAIRDCEHDKEQLLKRGTVIRTVTDTPMSPTLMVLQPLDSSDDDEQHVQTDFYDGTKSLGEIWLQTRVKPECLVQLPSYKGLINSQRTEEGGYLGRLYPNLSSDSEDDEKAGGKTGKAVASVDM